MTSKPKFLLLLFVFVLFAFNNFFFFNSDVFVIRKIEIDGYLSDKLKKSIESKYINSNIIFLKVKKIKELIKKQDVNVKDVIIKKYYPDKLFIKLILRKSFSKLAYKGYLFTISDGGFIISKVKNKSKPFIFVDFPLYIGKRLPSYILKELVYIRNINKDFIQGYKLKSILLTKDGSLVLFFDKGLKIRFGRYEKVDLKKRIISKLLNFEDKERRIKNIKLIDLTNLNSVYIRYEK